MVEILARAGARFRVGMRVRIGVATVLALFGLGLLITLRAQSSMRASRVESSRQVLTAIARSAADDFGSLRALSRPALDRRLAPLVQRNPDLRRANLYVVNRGRSTLVASSQDLLPGLPPGSAGKDDVLALRTHSVSYHEDGRLQYAELGFPVGPRDRPVAVLGLYFDLKPLEHAVGARVHEMLLVLGVAALLVAALMLLFLERALFAPLNQLTGATVAVSQGRRGVRVGWKRSGELGHLGRAFDHMSEAVDEREHLRQLSSTDSLTMLSNHRAFHETLDAELSRCRRTGGRFSVVLLDLDGFKQINDNRGHAAGDELLIQVGKTLRAGCRLSDTVARVGGDEFGLLLCDTDRASAIATVARLTNAIVAIGGGVSASFGVAEWPTDGSDKAAVMLHADLALYATKGPSTTRPRPAAPRIGVPSPAEPARDRAAGRDERIQQILIAARAELEMDIAYLSEFTDGAQVIRMLSGDASSFGFGRDTRVPLEESYCERMVRGEIPNAIRDTSQEETVQDLAATSERDIGSYVGVPLRLGDGQLYGTLCAVSHATSPQLREREITFMHVLARLIADEIEHCAMEAEHTRASIVGALLTALNTRDNYTSEHSESVVELATQVAVRLGLNHAERAEVGQAALLHDIGKLGLPDSILQKRGSLTDEEWRQMREHPVLGAELVSAIPALAHLAPVIRAEHERWAGGGYPDGLTGEAIPLPARIVFACDAFHAMTSDRPYRSAMSIEDACAELKHGAGTQFDPRVVQALLTMLDPTSSPASQSASQKAPTAKSPTAVG